MPFRAVSDGFQLKEKATQNLQIILWIHLHPTLIHRAPINPIPNPQFPNPRSQPGITLVFTLSPPTEHGTLHLVRSVQPQTLSHDAVAVETKQLVCVQLGIT